MFPIRDNIRSCSTPFVMYALIVLNAAVFLQEIAAGDVAMEKIVRAFGLVPFDFLQGFANDFTQPFIWLPLVSNLFLHGGWLHLLGNMWYLKIFGDNVEDRMGHGGFLAFYLFCGVAANIMQIVVDPTSRIPTIGASGAISGVLGAYFVLFPSAKISTVVFLFFFITIVDLPALIFLAFWFFMQLESGVASIVTMGTNVAWWAHIGGFLSGMAIGVWQRNTSKINIRK